MKVIADHVCQGTVNCQYPHPLKLNGHGFAGREERATGREFWPFEWRWVCSCGSKGRWTTQSPNVPYHSWLTHARES